MSSFVLHGAFTVVSTDAGNLPMTFAVSKYIQAAGPHIKDGLARNQVFALWLLRALLSFALQFLDRASHRLDRLVFFRGAYALTPSSRMRRRNLFFVHGRSGSIDHALENSHARSRSGS